MSKYVTKGSNWEILQMIVIIIVGGIVSHILNVFGFGVLSFLVGALTVLLFFGVLLQM